MRQVGSRRYCRLFASYKVNAMQSIALILILLVSLTNHATSVYPLATVKQETQFVSLLKELRCLVCQNQDLADSNASLANDLREQVYQMVKLGRNDNEIRQYLTLRYGDFILFKPPIKSLTVLLWFGPILFLLLGMVIFWYTCLK
jgi:cytochrome c-type biogenesis protein CcmH